MINETLLTDAADELIQANGDSGGTKRYTTYTWTDDGRPAAKRDILFPKVGYWDDSPPPAESKRAEFMSSVIADDDVPLIKSERGAATVLQRFIRKQSIEQHRNGAIQSDPNFIDSLHSSTATVRAICPIIGASVTEPIGLTESLRIRPVTDREKELLLNHRNIGGGSLSVEKTIHRGGLTHVAVHEHTTEPTVTYIGGATVVSGVDYDPQGIFEAVATTLQLIHSKRVEMGNFYLIDDNFYPVITMSGEPVGMDAYIAHEPDIIQDTERVSEFYDLISTTERDEGLRVAIDRLASSYTTTSNADAITDVIIGIEAILSTDDQDSFRDVRRKAAILIDEKSAHSSLGQYAKIRHGTVHGEERSVDSDDVREARDILSGIIAEVLQIQVDHEMSREDIVNRLDDTINAVVREQFDELIETFDPE